MGKQVSKCTIVSGSPMNDAEFLADKIDNNSFIIAADSGYTVLNKAGIKPDLIIGDFDSSPKPNADCEIIVLNPEKAYTDTFTCVREAVKREFKQIDIFFAIGTRFDHTYANVLCLDYCLKHGVDCTIIDRHNRLSLIEKSKTFNKEYDNFSLFAFMGECKGVAIKGAYYDAGFYSLQKLDFKPWDQIANSNYIDGEECTVSVEKGILLLAESND